MLGERMKVKKVFLPFWKYRAHCIKWVEVSLSLASWKGIVKAGEKGGCTSASHVN